jgi:hypothetical protein
LIIFKRGSKFTTTKIAKTYDIMSANGLVCVYYRGRFAVAQMGDAWAYGEGMRILRFLREPGNIGRLREGLQYVATLIPEGLKEIKKMPSLFKSSPGPFYKGTPATILNMIAQEATAENYVPIWLSLNFAITSRCNWAYIVDLDRNTFDVFVRRERKREAPTTRFSNVGGDNVHVPALVKSFSFSQLPAADKEFLRALETGMEERGGMLFNFGLLF